MNVNGLTAKGDTATATYTIANTSADLSAVLSATTSNTNDEFFKVTQNIAKGTVAAGDSTTITVTVELIKTPITIFMAIGYASVNSITGEISGKATAKLQDDVFITNVEYESDNDAVLSSSNIQNYVGTMMKSTIKLSDTNADSSITYKVTVYNSSDEDVPFTEVIYGNEFYDNENIVFELSGFTIGQTIGPKETKDILITFKYKDGTIPDNQTLNSYLNFKLKVPNRIMAVNNWPNATDKFLTGTVTREKIEKVSFKRKRTRNNSYI